MSSLIRWDLFQNTIPEMLLTLVDVTIAIISLMLFRRLSAFCVVVGSFFVAFLLFRVFKVRIREYPLNVDREWRDWRPANPFRFPWSSASSRDTNSRRAEHPWKIQGERRTNAAARQRAHQE